MEQKRRARLGLFLPGPYVVERVDGLLDIHQAGTGLLVAHVPEHMGESEDTAHLLAASPLLLDSLAECQAIITGYRVVSERRRLRGLAAASKALAAALHWKDQCAA